MFNYICLVCYLIASHIFLRELHHVWIRFRIKDKILLYRVDSKSVITDPKFIISGFSTFVLILLPQDSSDLPIKIALLVVYIIHPLFTSPDENDVLERCNLTIGYGAALWYYKNYLTLFFPHNFLERVRFFESWNKVNVEKKLFLLIPDSCIAKPYLEDETDCIERCQELPKCEKTNSGFKGRVYNITVYLVKTNFGRKRMAVEYAQPLKGLFAFKEKELLSESEMFYQRKLFVESLRKFLKDGNDLYEFCEIVEYNDNNRKVSDVLIEHCQFGNSIYEIV